MRTPKLVTGLGLALLASSPLAAQSSFADKTTMTWDGVLTGVFVGLLLFSIVYNIAFYTILRERFLLWQIARAITYVALSIGLSPLDMGSLLTPDSFARQAYIYVLFDLGIALSMPFLRTYFEPGMIGKWLAGLMTALPFIIMATTPALFLWERLPAYGIIRSAVLVSTLVIACTAVIVAWRRGSRVARYQAAAWSGLTFVFGTSLYHDIVLERPFEGLLFAMYPALALEAMLTAFGIADRLMRLRRSRDAAQASIDALQVIAHTDPLTGLINRRGIEEHCAMMPPAALAIVDLDHFKTVNDVYGHDVGDRVLFAAATALASGSAVAGRIGGEEFVLLLYGSADAAQQEAERLRGLVCGQVAALAPEVQQVVSASLGFALAAPDSNLRTLLKIADFNLYAAKREGRDRSVFPKMIDLRPAA